MKEVVFEKEHGKPYDFYRSFVSLFGQRFTGRGILTEFNYEEWHKRRLILNTAFHRKYESLILGREYSTFLGLGNLNFIQSRACWVGCLFVCFLLL